MFLVYVIMHKTYNATPLRYPAHTYLTIRQKVLTFSLNSISIIVIFVVDYFITLIIILVIIILIIISIIAFSLPTTAEKLQLQQ